MTPDHATAAAAPEPERPPSPWLTVDSAAKHAAVSTDTIYFACARGELRHVRIGGRRSIRIRVEWIDAWMERDARGEQPKRVQ
jgi:excisionase family DNA binding protein